MCSQCSFQTVLRNLRFKPARHPHNARQVLAADRRSFTTTSASRTAASAVLIPRSKAFSFNLPSLSVLSQSYSIWNPRQAAPPTPLPQEVLAENPFASHDDAARLLYSLACHPYTLSDIDNVVCPTLAGLLSIRHYAGARAVLERVLQEILKLPDLSPPFGRKPLNKIISTLLGADYHAFRKLDGRELHSLAPMRSMLLLILRYLNRYPDKFSLHPQTIRLLVCVPEYLTPRMMVSFLKLFEKVIKEHRQGRAFATSIPTLHNIMRAYALHGDSDTAFQWMNAILEAEKAQLPSRDAVIGPPASREYEKSGSRSAQPDCTTDSRRHEATTSQRLAATYIMSLARARDEEDRPIKDISSSKAMEVFEQLWRGRHGHKDEHQDLHPSHTMHNNLDIHAWTAMLHASALDLHKVSSEKLLDVLNTLQDNASLPSPNSVTYTVVLEGLNRRGDYHLAKRLFEQDILPKAIDTMKKVKSSTIIKRQDSEGIVFDSQVLGALTHSLAGLGHIQMACKMVAWFGLRHTTVELSQHEGGADDQQATHCEAVPPEGSASDHLSLPVVLRGTVKIDTLLINQLMTYLAKMYRFNSVYNLFNAMTDIYGVYPDESTLAILAKTALTSAKIKKRGLIPDHAEDLWTHNESKTAFSSTDVNGQSQHVNEHLKGRSASRSAIDAPETGVWDGQDPIKRVMGMYWSMLEQNLDAAYFEALQDDIRVKPKGLFSFGVGEPKSASQVHVSKDDVSDADADLPIQKYHMTSGLTSTSSVDDYKYAWPSLHPTAINMHMLVVLSGYLGRASDIPLVMSHMKALHIKPNKSTLCLALWLYEESGVYSHELRDFRFWLGDWLGTSVPSDETIGAFRARQWAGKR